MATRQRVIVYCMNFAPEIAGVGKYTGEIAEHLIAEGADVTVVTTPPHYPGWRVQSGYGNRYSTSMQDGMRVLRVPLILRRNMKGIWRLIAPLSFAATSAPVIFWQILRTRPATVFCIEPTLFAAPIAQLAAKLVGSQVVLHVQDLEVDAAFAVGHLGSKTWLKKLGYAFERMTLHGFDRVVTISNRMADKLVEKGLAAERVSVVRNWVDLSHIFPMREISPYRAELGFGERDFVVLYSGNIGAKQGLNILLQAAEQLRPASHIHFVVAGEGPAKADLQSRYGHLPNIRFLPFQPYSRLNEFLNMPDLHVLPQERDAADLVLPSKLGGMLASGQPILVTADPDTELAHVLGDAVCYCEPGNAGALADAIQAVTIGPAGRKDARLEIAGTLGKDECLRMISLAVAPAPSTD
ncbi:WcaI family glycosyltransferase [Neorhizobium lilium]|uniref:WcaI family glycosyltransferase n=1 Tax=Neorhizobium lilium TaxID=2503024 RepID=UPI001FDEF0EA|nr:WcaI family glycosyltransferase [Neorhizobium lilium]